MRKTLIIAILILTLCLLTACSSEEGIIGRWEFSEGNFEVAFEFYPDGTGATWNSIDPFDHGVGTFDYVYEPEKELLTITVDFGPEHPPKIREWKVSLPSKDQMVMDQSTASLEMKPFNFSRAPLPDLPAEARSRLGIAMVMKEFEFVDAEELASGWEEDYQDYRLVALTQIEVTVGVEVEEWLVTLRMAEDNQEHLYILRRDIGRWGVLELVKNE